MGIPLDPSVFLGSFSFASMGFGEEHRNICDSPHFLSRPVGAFQIGCTTPPIIHSTSEPWFPYYFGLRSSKDPLPQVSCNSDPLNDNSFSLFTAAFALCARSPGWGAYLFLSFVKKNISELPLLFLNLALWPNPSPCLVSSRSRRIGLQLGILGKTLIPFGRGCRMDNFVS